MNLFQTGDFTLSSGLKSWFKIDCDALTDEDIKTLAKLIYHRMPGFTTVVGIPTGGLRLAKALEEYVEPTYRKDILLIVDDVLTTGKTMEQYKNKVLEIWPDTEIHGVVIFDRRNPLSMFTSENIISNHWVMAIFTSW